MAGARVELGAGTQIIAGAVTDADGRYSVIVAPGTYTVRVAVAESAATSGNSRTVTLEPGGRVVADFHLTFMAL
jgi:hypothetical protein